MADAERVARERKLPQYRKHDRLSPTTELPEPQEAVPRTTGRDCEQSRQIERLSTHYACRYRLTRDDRLDCLQDLHVTLLMKRRQERTERRNDLPNAPAPQAPIIELIAMLAAHTARNCSLRQQRARRRCVSLQDDANGMQHKIRQLPDTRASPLECLLRRQQAAELEQALGCLSELNRELMIAHYLEETSVLELANRYHLSVSCVKMRLMRARQDLRRRLEAGNEPPGKSEATEISNKVVRKCDRAPS